MVLPRLRSYRLTESADFWSLKDPYTYNILLDVSFLDCRMVVFFALLGNEPRYDVFKQAYGISETNEGFLKAFALFGKELSR